MSEKRTTEEQVAEAGRKRADVPLSPAAPRKVEGDALLSGTGTRHGVERADERPATEERDDTPGG